MKLFKLTILSIGILLLTSCGAAYNQGGGLTKTSNQTYSPTNAESIEIFSSTKPDKDFVEIGTISVMRYKFVLIFPSKRNADDIMQDMKKEAASIGGNAIIDYKESGDVNMVGTIIRYK